MSAADKATSLPIAYRFPRRLIQLQIGLILYGLSMALLVRARLGLDPWDVFHQGVTQRTGLTFGTVTIITGAAVLLLWIPLRQRPGLGTVSNVIVIGVAVDTFLWLIPAPSALWLRVTLLVLGIVGNGLATGMYIGARLGPGPRDGLMTALSGPVTRSPSGQTGRSLAKRTGRSIRLIRTAIEVTVLAAGFVLGGTVGIATILYALSIGPLTQLFLPWFAVREPASGLTGAAPSPAALR